ncbi:SMP-30/gluconolactonase/LRE family protein [Streptomyces sp. NPDC048636]|uniref:SMP-30/gluconolactonase/LRE family protein n=1 Tax=Streptomyces sp. NPDC048636 TaxID=3155762 RepID=UPI00343884A0
MPRALPRRALAVAVTVLATVLPLAPAARATAPAPRPAAHHPTEPRISAAYALPGDRVYPEGIAADPRTGTLYAGSYADGTVYRMTPGHRVAEVLLPAGTDGRATANGLKVDGAGRLWVTDSTAGVSVYDPRTRRLLARFDVAGPGARFVNDLAIAPDGSAYLTDSLRGVVYRVTPRQLARAQAHGGHAALTPRFDLNAAMEPHDPGTYTLNGIVADPTGRHLLTVDSTGGDLYRLEPSTGRISRVALHGGDLRLADGLELRHGTLWAAHNTDNAISRWRVAPDGHAARQERRFTDEALQVPTTLIRRHGTLYVVRSQFDKGGPLGDNGTPRTPFTVAAVTGI